MSIPITRLIGSLFLEQSGAGGRRDTYGSALSAQPGRSQGRPATNASSQLIEYIGLPALGVLPVPLSRMVAPYAENLASPAGTVMIIPVTNAIEALNSKLRRAVRTRGHFPSDDAAMKLLYLVLNHAAEEGKRPPREWFEAKTQFAVVFGERFVSQ